MEYIEFSNISKKVIDYMSTIVVPHLPDSEVEMKQTIHNLKISKVSDANFSLSIYLDTLRNSNSPSPLLKKTLCTAVKGAIKTGEKDNHDMVCMVMDKFPEMKETLLLEVGYTSASTGIVSDELKGRYIDYIENYF